MKMNGETHGEEPIRRIMASVTVRQGAGLPRLDNDQIRQVLNRI
ncbi:MAG: hypothetical protein ACLSA6_18230 [Holdemania massiliensis]